MRRFRKVLLMTVMMFLLTGITGCSEESVIARRNADDRDLKLLADGRTQGIVERRLQEAKTVYDERTGVMITKTQADVYSFLSTAKYYAIVAAIVCFVIGLIIRIFLGSSSMSMKRLGTFLTVAMPIICVVFVVVSSFVVDAVY